MNEQTYRRIKIISTIIRGFIGLSAFAGLVVSVIFSQMGFKIEVQGYAVIGYVVALINTALQMVLRYSDGKAVHPVLLISSIFAYLYGIASNLIGFLSLRDGGELILQNPKDSLFTILFITLFSTLLEVVPEFMIMWALFNDGIPNIILKIAGTKPSTTYPQGSQTSSKPVKSAKQHNIPNNRRKSSTSAIRYPAVSRKAT